MNEASEQKYDQRPGWANIITSSMCLRPDWHWRFNR